MKKGESKEAYNEYYRKYMLERYYKRRAAAIELLGGTCKICGSDSNLEIDHIEPKDKLHEIGRILSSGSNEKVFNELRKCQLLCKNCHTEKSITDCGKSKSEHGSYSMYRNYKCRCDLCKNAAKLQARKQRAKRRELTGKDR